MINVIDGIINEKSMIPGVSEIGGIALTFFIFSAHICINLIRIFSLRHQIYVVCTIREILSFYCIHASDSNGLTEFMNELYAAAFL